MIPPQPPPSASPLSQEAITAFLAIRLRLGEGEATTAQLDEVVAKTGVSDNEARTRILELLWTRGFIYSSNAVRGTWRVTKP